jgi:hypothetical protein
MFLTIEGDLVEALEIESHEGELAGYGQPGQFVILDDEGKPAVTVDGSFLSPADDLEDEFEGGGDDDDEVGEEETEDAEDPDGAEVEDEEQDGSDGSEEDEDEA